LFSFEYFQNPILPSLKMKTSALSLLTVAASVSAGNKWGDKSTTSTVYTTSVYTITSCAPEVTDCPGKIGSVTTDVISLYTTICPVTETESSSTWIRTSTPSAPITSETPWTTSTIYTTKEYTITSCPPEVTNCPVSSKTSSVETYTTSCPVSSIESPPVTTETPWTTSTIYTTKEYTITSCPPEVTNCPYGSKTSSVATYTTYCPVSTTLSPPVSTSTESGKPSGPATSAPPAPPAPVLSTITISTCIPTYITSVVTVTAVANPVSTGSGYSCPGGSSCPETETNTYTKPYSTGTPSTYPYAPKNSTVPFLGAASANKAGGLLMAVGLVAALL
jgi:hypothetical protein